MLNTTSIQNNSFVEIDFSKTVSLESLVDSEFTVETVTNIKTKYGNKLSVISPTGENFYANEIIADKLSDVKSYPVTIYITKKESKAGNSSYYTCYIQNERISVKDYINQRLVIKKMSEIQTEYGTRYICVTDDRKEFMTNWKSLYNFYLENKEDFESEGCELYPVIRHSEKTDRDYVAFSDTPDQPIVKKTVIKQRPKRPGVNTNLLPD